MKHMGRRSMERHVFLFDSLIILCKQNVKRSSVTGPVAEFKLKEKYFLRKLEITDREDQEGNGSMQNPTCRLQKTTG